MLVRTLCCGLLLAVLGVVPAVAQTSNTSSAQNTTTTTETRPGLPTFFGDTGFWFVPTAETLPSRKVSVSAFRANFDRREGLTDVGIFGVTGAIGLSGRVEVFGSWRLVRLRRAVRSPVFVPSQADVGGVLTEFPYLRRGWSDNLGGPVTVGAKWNLISQSRGDAMSLAPRVVFTFPTGSPWSGTNDWDSRIEVIASREFARMFEATGSTGAILRADPPEFSLSDGVSWGIGASFPSRKPLRALVEWTGEVLLEHDTGVVNPPYTAEDRSIAPLFSTIPYPADLKVGGVWQMSNGLFLHGGFNYSVRSGDTTVPVNRVINHHGWGYDVRLGWHPGTRVYVPPPPPAPIVREVVREVPVPAPAPAPAPPANRPPQITVSCDPCTVAPGQSSKVSATAIDPDGDPVIYRWTAPQGAFAVPADPNTTWTAPNQVGTVPLTATASDNRGGSASGTVNVQVVRREQLVFEDVHFDFDKYNLRPDALKILDDAITRLQANPDLNVTIEGHCDSIGTNEYNLALGERRSNVVRDYLAMRGVAAGRLRTVSYGEERPIADNSTAAGRAMNRRAHLAVIIQ